MRIALDAMGGDFAPGPNVVGAFEAVERNPKLEILLVGDRARLEDRNRESRRSPQFHSDRRIGGSRRDGRKANGCPARKTELFDRSLLAIDGRRRSRRRGQCTATPVLSWLLACGLVCF